MIDEEFVTVDEIDESSEQMNEDSSQRNSKDSQDVSSRRNPKSSSITKSSKPDGDKVDLASSRSDKGQKSTSVSESHRRPGRFANYHFDRYKKGDRKEDDRRKYRSRSREGSRGGSGQRSSSRSKTDDRGSRDTKSKNTTGSSSKLRTKDNSLSGFEKKESIKSVKTPQQKTTGTEKSLVDKLDHKCVDAEAADNAKLLTDKPACPDIKETKPDDAVDHVDHGKEQESAKTSSNTDTGKGKEADKVEASTTKDSKSDVKMEARIKPDLGDTRGRSAATVEVITIDEEENSSDVPAVVTETKSTNCEASSSIDKSTFLGISINSSITQLKNTTNADKMQTIKSKVNAEASGKVVRNDDKPVVDRSEQKHDQPTDFEKDKKHSKRDANKSKSDTKEMKSQKTTNTPKPNKSHRKPSVSSPAQRRPVGEKSSTIITVEIGIDLDTTPEEDTNTGDEVASSSKTTPKRVTRASKAQTESSTKVDIIDRPGTRKSGGKYTRNKTTRQVKDRKLADECEVSVEIG